MAEEVFHEVLGEGEMLKPALGAASSREFRHTLFHEAKKGCPGGGPSISTPPA